jgi:membrane fusion protein (multidrug efflux system)
MNLRFRPGLPAAVLALSLLAAGCDKPAPPPKPEPPQVGVITLQPRSVPAIYEQVGQTAGFREIEVRSRVAGILQKRLYEEGRPVKEGQPLFQIDPEPFKAKLDQARGQLRQQEANLDRARADRDRIEPLFRENAVSRKDFDDARSAYENALAAVDSVRAQVREAELNLGYTLVTAPIAGIASKEAMSEGSLVATSGDASLLTVISQLDPIFVNFSFSESEKLRYEQEQQTGRIVSAPSKRAEAHVKLADGRNYARAGFVDFADSRVDPTTGTIRARAEFPNPDGELLPGQFARIAINIGTLKDALIVPERAITQQQATRLVLVVNAQNVVEPHPVKLGRRLPGNEVEVVAGLAPGMRVIVDGLMKARPGSPVRPMPAGTAPGAQGKPGGPVPGKPGASPQPPAAAHPR